ncbi:hypothetical protein ACS0TY_013610 [Phlomoides rotata]
MYKRVGVCSFATMLFERLLVFCRECGIVGHAIANCNRGHRRDRDRNTRGHSASGSKYRPHHSSSRRRDENANGFGNDHTKNVPRYYCLTYNPDRVAIYEPKVHFSTIKSRFWRSSFYTENALGVLVLCMPGPHTFRGVNFGLLYALSLIIPSALWGISMSYLVLMNGLKATGILPVLHRSSWLFLMWLNFMTWRLLIFSLPGLLADLIMATWELVLIGSLLMMGSWISSIIFLLLCYLRFLQTTIQFY